MALSKPLRSLSTAVRIFRDEGPGGILLTLQRKAIELQKQRDRRAILEHETLSIYLRKSTGESIGYRGRIESSDLERGRRERSPVRMLTGSPFS